MRRKVRDLWLEKKKSSFAIENDSLVTVGESYNYSGFDFATEVVESLVELLGILSYYRGSGL